MRKAIGKIRRLKMKRYLISNEGNFYKANLHCHTTVSDGKLTPEEVKALYKGAGYSAVAFTDHDIFLPHHELSDDSFIALSGFEAEFNANYPSGKDYKTSHICFIAGKRDNDIHPIWNPVCAYIGNSPNYHDRIKYDPEGYTEVRSNSPECINSSIKRAREAGFFITYNHPVWSLDDYNQYAQYKGMHAVEIYNHGCEVYTYHSYVPEIYDDILRLGNRIFPVSADDNHNVNTEDSYGFDSLGGFVMIKAERLEYEALTDALFRGDFYASQGPEIKELYIEDGKIKVKTSGAVSIGMSTARRSSKTKFANRGEYIYEAEFPLDREEKYFRITVTDDKGRHANSRAYFLDEL